MALTAAAALGSLVLQPFLAPDTFLLFLGAVWLSAWYYGRPGGITTSAVSSVAIFYFFLKSTSEPQLPLWAIAVRLLCFIALAALITWLTSAWRESRRLLEATLSSTGDAVIATDGEGCVTFLNPIAETLTGWSRREARNRHASEVLKLFDERTRQPVENPLERALRERATVALTERTLMASRNGAESPIELSASPVRDDSDGVRGAILVFRDIGKRRQLEEQATHAEKMEAVGRLARGVAGDFNNVLTVITGYAELLRAEAPAASPLRRFVDEIIYAGERAAALTRHLLAFSRGSSAQPRVLDLSQLVAEMEPMLRRILGEGIELLLMNPRGAGRVKADASQLEQAIVNLATNARDAMPQGGKLVIEVASVDLEEGASSKNLGLAPGPYVLMAISDTGIGMDAATRSRLFEPFFTSKDPGKGSGLGLATVYGIVKQHEGQITVYSQPNCGSIFEIYLPRVKEAPVEVVPRRASAKGSETILLVDDEEGVRKLVHAVLQSHGYDVLEASNGGMALQAYDKNSHKIDLVLTDVVMPQMTGFELGAQLAGRAPHLKILYMSGYRDNATGPHETPKAFLHKPFTPDVLLNKVREVLDGGLNS